MGSFMPDGIYVSHPIETDMRNGRTSAAAILIDDDFGEDDRR
jgi:hypothetical protein